MVIFPEGVVEERCSGQTEDLDTIVVGVTIEHLGFEGKLSRFTRRALHSYQREV